MFDEKLSEYLKKNGDKHSEREWEDIIPKMYEKFGDTMIKSLGKSPNEYFAQMSDEQLIACLKAHLKQDVGVSMYLCNAIEGRGNEQLLLPLLRGSEDEISYALNLLGASKCALPEYMRLLITSESEDVRNTCVDYIKEYADEVKAEALENYKKGVQSSYMLEILSRCVIHDDEIFDILIKQFRSDADNLPMLASYLAAYGDERALPYLLDKIDEEGISYIEYQELKYAIESLGGSYDKPRDFSSDPYFQAISVHSSKEGINIFNQEENK